MGANRLLRDLAGKTAHAPEPPGFGRYHHVHTVGAYRRTNRFLSRTGESTVTSVVEHLERKQWIAPDGSGRLLVTQGEEVMVPPSGDYAAGQLPDLFITATDEASFAGQFGRLTQKTTTAGVMKAFRQVWNLRSSRRRCSVFSCCTWRTARAWRKSLGSSGSRCPTPVTCSRSPRTPAS
ncbi:hypothetical protein [Lentzea sp. NPDC092896]|uniref:hypothetical protein n=1 Tax=Lentzea sp. NPDC092896 TaxID=3364127 RepID=UPI003808F2DC